jgi:C-terminal processing protease CtpA/Prc
MKKKSIIIVLIFAVSILSCKKFNPEDAPLYTQINDFIWKGMNTIYLWQEEVPVLADKRFESEKELFDYLDNYGNPADFFESVKYQPNTIDKWSWIVDDYVALEAYFSGVRKSTGAKIKLYLTAENSSDVYGIVRYVVPNTDAADKPILRGDVFNSVDGVLLNTSNYRDLIYNNDSYTLNLGSYHYNTDTQIVEITSIGKDVTLSKGEYSENPVLINTTFTIDSQKIGYLMYNSFTSDYNHTLNDAFLTLKNENITDLILDLRYNGGGSVKTALYLTGMITGQFTGNIFTQEEWNPKIQADLKKEHPEWLVNHFTNTMDDGTALNSLGLDRLIVLTTGDSASASELVINALNPYIDVVTIGRTTHGKYVASVTLYDSVDFTKNNVNPNHNWAIQPIVLKEVNSLGEYSTTGFVPKVLITEDQGNMGVLGSQTEPMTAKAIDYIINGSTSDNKEFDIYNAAPNQIKGINRFENEMYIENKINLSR